MERERSDDSEQQGVRDAGRPQVAEHLSNLYLAPDGFVRRRGPRLPDPGEHQEEDDKDDTGREDYGFALVLCQPSTA